MSGAFNFEYVQQDILGALRLVDDVTGRTVLDAVQWSTPDLTLRRKSSGDLVILAAQGLVPGPGKDYPIDIRPLGPAYAPRRVLLHLPRDPDPAHAGTVTSLFEPALVPLLPAPGYPMAANVALVRVTLRRSTDQARIGGGLVRLTSNQPGVGTARALTDVAGEAVLVITGVPLSNLGPDTRVVGDIAASVDALVDPALATFTADADLDAARVTVQTQSAGFVDPDDLATRLGAAAPPGTSLRIGAGRVAFADLAWVPA